MHQFQHQHQHPDEHPPDAAWITAQSKAHWDRSSTSYAEMLIRKGLTEPNFRQVIDVVVNHCKPDARIRVLDLASNAGSPAVPLGKAIPNARVVATDLSPASVSLISEYAASEGVTNLTAQPADAQHLQDFGDNTFDAVTCSYGLMFMPDHQKALQEAHRVLKLGGLYVATVWGPLEHYQFGQLGPDGQSRSLLDKLKANGKENIHEEAPLVDMTSSGSSHWTQYLANGHYYKSLDTNAHAKAFQM